MVDTIRLNLSVNPDKLIHCLNEKGLTSNFVSKNENYSRTVLNPNKRSLTYQPKLTYHRRCSSFGASNLLQVEFSAPKMLFGNNLNELTNTDLEQLIGALQKSLYEQVGYQFSRNDIKNAPVSVIHFSKNFLFKDNLSCLTLIDSIAKIDVSKTYDIQKTQYRMGSSVQVHCNTLDVIFYDKIAEVKQSIKSKKRSVESNSEAQPHVLKEIEKLQSINIFRYELRLSSRRKIKTSFSELNQWDLKTLFNENLSQQILLHYWQKITSDTDFLSLDATRPRELLENYMLENPKATVSHALQATAALMVVQQTGFRSLQELVLKSAGSARWYRLKQLIQHPEGIRYTKFKYVEKELEMFEPFHFPLLE